MLLSTISQLQYTFSIFPSEKCFINILFFHSLNYTRLIVHARVGNSLNPNTQFHPRISRRALIPIWNPQRKQNPQPHRNWKQIYFYYTSPHRPAAANLSTPIPEYIQPHGHWISSRPFLYTTRYSRHAKSHYNPRKLLNSRRERALYPRGKIDPRPREGYVIWQVGGVYMSCDAGEWEGWGVTWST